jgi:hypothetical protein
VKIQNCKASQWHFSPASSHILSLSFKHCRQYPVISTSACSSSWVYWHYTSTDHTLVVSSQSYHRKFVCFWRDSPQWDRASSFTRLLNHTQRRTTVGKTPLGKWPARRRDLYMTIHNIHNRQTSMPPAEFKPTISADEPPQAYALDRAATATCSHRK